MENTPSTYASPENDLLMSLKKERDIACDYQDRRRDDWNDNYELYRNKVRTNRLTQRQATNIPLMKETVKTILAQVDDPPIVDWSETGGDLDKNIIVNERWEKFSTDEDIQLKDIQDKKNVILYGRSFRKLNYIDGEVKLNILDIFDVVVDPLTDPLDIEKARFLIHQNIYKTANQIKYDTRYDKKAKEEFAKYQGTPESIIESEKNKSEAKRRNERLEAVGVVETDFDKFGADDTLIHICEHYRKEWKENKWQWYVYVYADSKVLLMKDKLKTLIGIERLPFVTWCEDIETQDFWSDGPADTVRTPNKVVNVWFSQMIENRTLSNFRMQWYDATTANYTPQTYEPGPGRMLPAPGDPHKTIMPVEVSGLADTMDQIEYVIKVAERATGASGIEKGASDEKSMTLGEVQILVGKSLERALTMTPFYRKAWEKTAYLWIDILDANEGDTSTTTLFKKGANGKLWPKKVTGKDWKGTYKANVASSSEQETEKTKSVQRFLLLQKFYPENQALTKIVQKRLLTLVDMTPEEIKEVEEAEKKKNEQVQAQTQAQPQGQGAGDQELNSMLAELETQQ